jgi:hypothetical protein
MFARKFAGLVIGTLVLSGAAWARGGGGGNGSSTGSHYNLNILGKDNCSGDDLTGSNRHSIQVLLDYSDGDGGYWDYSTDPATWVPSYEVDLDRRNKIFLAEGTDFDVLDGNACDSDGAKIELPGSTGYGVYVRELGTPGGWGDMTTCGVVAGDDGVAGTADDEVVCSTENVVLNRTKGRSTFRDVTTELTTMLLDTDGDGRGDTRYDIFDSELEETFWDFDNHGLRLVQLRFYPY